MNGLRTFRAIEIRMLNASYYVIRLHRLVLWAIAAVFSMLSIMFPANMPPAFAQEASNSVKQQVDSLFEKVSNVRTNLDEFGNLNRLLTSEATESIRKLGNQLSSIEKQRRKIEKDEAIAKLKEPEKEAFQNQLESLKDETSALQMQVKMLLQYAPFFQSLKSLIDSSSRDRKQGIRISTLVPYMVLFEFVVLLMFAIIGFLWYRKNSRNLNELLLLPPRALSNQETELSNIKNFTSKVNSLIQKVDSVELGLKNIGQAVQPKQTPKGQNDSIRAKESQEQTFCRLYNAAVEDSNERNKFIQRYKPVRISVTNVMARYHSLSIEPIFETVPDGDYYAAAIEGNTLYVVVPRFDLTFQESIYGPGAMGQVFNCPGYDSQLRYSRVKVVKPAFFEPDSARRRWKLKEKGELDLKQSESAILPQISIQQEQQPQILSKIANLENLPSKVDSLIHEVGYIKSGLQTILNLEQGNFAMLSPQSLSKLANLENLPSQVELLIHEVSSIQSGLKNLEQIGQKQQTSMQQERQPQSVPQLANLEDFSSKLDALIQEISSIQSRLKTIEQILQKQQTPIQQELQLQKTQNDLIPTEESASQMFCRLYNAAVEDSNERNKFMQHYQLIRIGVANVMSRVKDSIIAPDFQTSPDGDYYAIAIEKETLFAVVPSFNLTLQESIYGPGAMGLVFDCPNYNPQRRYRGVKVAKPAFFELEPAKQRWTLKEKGELDLGQGE